MPSQSRALFYRLLQNETPEPREVAGLVRAFIAQREAEGQWFDVKAGALVQQRNGDELRAAVCAFANAEGGFLLIGYDERRQAYDHARPVGGRQPEQWVTDSLGPMAHAIPPPRFETVEVEGGPVLLVAIERARSLLYVIEDGEPAYYLRFGHQSRKMSPNLVADLLLGRKARPELRITEVDVMDATDQPYPGIARAARLSLALTVNYENDAFTHAELVRCGLVGWTMSATLSLPRQVENGIDSEEPPDDTVSGGYPWKQWGLVHIRSGQADLEPSAPGQGVLQHWQTPLFNRYGPPRPGHGEVRSPRADDEARGIIEVKAALYLIAKNAEPTWWQLTLRYDQVATQQLSSRKSRHLRVDPCPYSRPVVSIHFVDKDESPELLPDT